MDAMARAIKPLSGEADYPMWKRKIRDILDYHEGTLDVVEGKLKKPDELADETSESELKNYKASVDFYRKANSYAKSLIASTVTDEVYQKIMEKETAHEAWEALKILFEATAKDQLFKICSEFFNFSWNSGDDVATHISKLSILWNELNNGLAAKKENKLPELLLVCKVLNILPDSFKSFKSSWMLLAKDNEKSFEELAAQLSMFERNFANCINATEKEESILIAKQEYKPSNKRFHTKKIVNKRDICNYCGLNGHWIKSCSKWIADGRPPKKSANPQSKPNNSQGNVLSLDMTVTCLSKESFPSEGETNTFWIDNGATKHVTNSLAYFTDFEKFPDSNSHTIKAAGKEVLRVLGKGNIKVKTLIGRKAEILELRDVWYVPGVHRNLFSVLAAQDRNQNSEFTSTPTECWLKVNNQVKIYGTRSINGTLYKAAIEPIFPDKVVEIECAESDSNKSSLLQLYHNRWGHQDKRHIRNLLKEEFDLKVNLDKEPCEPCIYGKSHRLKFGNKPKATKVGDLVSTDVCGPFDESKRKYRYFVVFKDSYSKYRYVFFLKHKSDVVFSLKSFLAHAENLGHSIKEILSDNGGEFDNKDVQDILQKKGITQRLTAPYTPQQNASERENRTLVEMARTLKYSSPEVEYPAFLWAELVNTAAYILNRTGISSVENVSPHELWFGKKPRIRHMRIIGSLCYAHIPMQKRKKMAKKALKGILIGYNGDERYRIWLPDEGKIVFSRDVIFHEKTKPCEEHVSLKNPVSIINLSNQEKSVEQIEEPEEPNAESENEEDDESRSSRNMQLRDRSQLEKPRRFDDYIMDTEAFIYGEDPQTYQEALENPDKENWKKAMDSEINSLKENQTWELTKLPEGVKAIPCKWVYRIKRNPDGSIEKYKARLVIKGFLQRKGINYNQTYSPVARASTIRSLISIAASENMTITQFDVSTAFLYGKLEEDIYMCQPEGYSDLTDRVCHLKKSLYGLKQAPRCWNKCFGEYLHKAGFLRSEADPCLFIRRNNSELLLLVLYVDDGLVASTSNEELEEFLKELKKVFKITTKPAEYYLGLEIHHQEDNSIKICQTAYIKKILERFGMDECKPVSTPIIKEGFQSGKVMSTDKSYPYRQAVGALIYIMTGSRPDIAYAIGVASRTLENPSEEDWQRVKRIFRYLKGTSEKGIIYKPGYKKGILEGYSDADHGGDTTTGRSTTGVVCIYAGGAISWSSQRQPSVAISTTEAEVVAASEAARELVWLKRLINEVTNLNVIPDLQVDNEAAVRLSQNQGELHKRTKHIRIRHFFVREMVANEEIVVRRVSTELQIADLFTKPLYGPRLSILREKMGLT